MESLPSLQRILFQSTPSVWRETLTASIVCGSMHHFNPLPPCGGRRMCCAVGDPFVQFQSTPSVWRETTGIISILLFGINFNPLPPCGGRRNEIVCFFGTDPISIHSLRVEGDQIRFSSSSGADISIHSLRVEGDVLPQRASAAQSFQSTPSVWRETQ